MGPDEFRVGYAPEAFVVDDTPDVRRAFKAVLRPAWYLGVAGLANDDHTRRTFYASLARIARELHRRGYQTVVHGIKAMPFLPLHGPAIEVAGLSTIMESLSRRGYAAGANAHTFFQYSGHGTMEGLVVNDSELLTPRMLFDVIGSIRGKKFLVLDACHAGVFLAAETAFHQRPPSWRRLALRMP